MAGAQTTFVNHATRRTSPWPCSELRGLGYLFLIFIARVVGPPSRQAANTF
jgi:hypothetical protein